MLATSRSAERFNLRSLSGRAGSHAATAMKTAGGVGAHTAVRAAQTAGPSTSSTTAFSNASSHTPNSFAETTPPATICAYTPGSAGATPSSRTQQPTVVGSY